MQCSMPLFWRSSPLLLGWQSSEPDVCTRILSLLARSMNVTCARIGSDEFGLLWPLGASDDATTSARLVVDIASQLMFIAGSLVKAGVSVGIARCPVDADGADALLRKPDIARIPVLAEGVETKEQARVLRELKCDLAQGWLYGKAAPNSELARHFKRSNEAKSQAAMTRLVRGTRPITARELAGGY